MSEPEYEPIDVEDVDYLEDDEHLEPATGNYIGGPQDAESE